MKLESSLPTIVPSPLLSFAVRFPGSRTLHLQYRDAYCIAVSVLNLLIVLMAASFDRCNALPAIAITALLTLSICRLIIEAREARIWPSSNAGPGINLRLVLPLRARRRNGP